MKDHTPRHRLGTNADLDGRDFVLLLDRTTDPPTLVLERLGCRIENLDIKGAQKAAEKRKKTAERRQKESTMNKGPSPGKSGSPPPVEASSSGATKGDVVEYSEASDDESEVPAVVVSGPVGDSRPEHRASKSSFHLAPPSKPGLLGSPAKPSPSSPYPSVILTPASSQTSDKSHELDLESFASELENDLSQKGSDLEDEALPLMAKDRTTKGRSKLSASQVIVEDLDIASDPDAAGTPVRQPEPETEPAGRTGGKTVASLDATYERMSTGGKSVASLTKLHGGPRTLGGSDDDESSDDDD